ncbi:hypothetical protein KAK10_04295 [Periweissella beninensis]|uniref:LacI family transcriptional regulator n=1 Tax=Periweissella beninensis TaxID=504936 RepID=A0ABT0VH44_9LACO|nr:hypothetical protein [Periweissella beninensis]
MEIKRRNIPVVFINSHYDKFTFPYLEMDDKSAENMLIEYLIKQGHEKILNSKNHPTAIAMYNDEMAIKVMNIIQC